MIYCSFIGKLGAMFLGTNPPHFNSTSRFLPVRNVEKKLEVRRVKGEG